VIAGLVLAGGGSRRMGGYDKSFLDLAGETLMARAVNRLRSQLDTLAISANRPSEQFGAFGVPVLADELGDGPLAGIAAGLRWAASLSPRPPHLVTVAVDTPFFPLDLVARLHKAAGLGSSGVIAMSRSGGRSHPVFALWPLAVVDALESHFSGGDDRSVRGFMAAQRAITVDFAIPPGSIDPFFNINTPDDLAAARQTVALRGRIA